MRHFGQLLQTVWRQRNTCVTQFDDTVHRWRKADALRNIIFSRLAHTHDTASDELNFKLGTCKRIMHSFSCILEELFERIMQNNQIRESQRFLQCGMEFTEISSHMAKAVWFWFDTGGKQSELPEYRQPLTNRYDNQGLTFRYLGFGEKCIYAMRLPRTMTKTNINLLRWSLDNSNKSFDLFFVEKDIIYSINL